MLAPSDLQFLRELRGVYLTVEGVFELVDTAVGNNPESWENN